MAKMPPKKTKTQPKIRQTQTPALSPFVVYLRGTVPDPQTLLDASHACASSVDLLATEEERAPSLRIDPVADLQLNWSDVQNQLSPDTNRLFDRINWPQVQWSFQRKPFAITDFSRNLPVLDLQTIVPAQPPEHLVDMFDWPQEEQGAEEDAEEEVASPFDIEPQKPFLPQPLFPSGWKRAMAAFVSVAVVTVLPLQAMRMAGTVKETRAHVSTQSEQALAYAKTGADAFLRQDADQAGTAFVRAAGSFAHAKDTVTKLDTATSLLLSALPSTRSALGSAKRLTQAGESLALAGARISQGLQTAQEASDASPTTRIALLQSYFASAIPYVQEAQQQLKRVDESILPKHTRENYRSLTKDVPDLLLALNEFNDLATIAQELLGADGMRRYLVLFQNNTELRPTGGFIGSYADLTVSGGKIVSLDIPGGGTYDLRGSLRTFTVAPKPLQLLSGRWEFQDANWYPDFPTSAKRALQFYEEAQGPTVDGVFALNATYVADLLALLGEIDMPEYDRTINAENFLFETQKLVELEYDKARNQPKTFLAALAPKLMDRLTQQSSENFLTIFARLAQGLASRDLQLYLTDTDLQREMVQRGWAGEMLQTDGDYLMIVDTNLGGGKTDAVIDQQADLQVTIGQDGSIINTLTVSRSHFGVRGALFEGQNNVDYLRVYVPEGSELLDAEGFTPPDASLFEKPQSEWTQDALLQEETSTHSTHPSGTDVTKSLGKTVFGNWVQTKPGHVSTVSFTYRLPQKLKVEGNGWMGSVKHLLGLEDREAYTLTIQKQSGVLKRTTNVSVQLPPNLHSVWSSHDLQNAAFTNASDTQLSILLEPAF